MNSGSVLFLLMLGYLSPILDIGGQCQSTSMASRESSKKACKIFQSAYYRQSVICCVILHRNCLLGTITQLYHSTFVKKFTQKLNERKILMTFWRILWRPLRSSEVDLKYLESEIKIQILIYSMSSRILQVLCIQDLQNSSRHAVIT